MYPYNSITKVVKDKNSQFEQKKLKISDSKNFFPNKNNDENRNNSTQKLQSCNTPKPVTKLIAKKPYKAKHSSEIPIKALTKQLKKFVKDKRLTNLKNIFLPKQRNILNDIPNALIFQHHKDIDNKDQYFIIIKPNLQYKKDPHHHHFRIGGTKVIKLHGARLIFNANYKFIHQEPMITMSRLTFNNKEYKPNLLTQWQKGYHEDNTVTIVIHEKDELSNSEIHGNIFTYSTKEKTLYYSECGVIKKYTLSTYNNSFEYNKFLANSCITISYRFLIQNFTNIASCFKMKELLELQKFEFIDFQDERSGMIRNIAIKTFDGESLRYIQIPNKVIAKKIIKQILANFSVDYGDIKAENTLWNGKTITFIDADDMTFTFIPHNNTILPCDEGEVERYQVFNLLLIIYQVYENNLSQQIEGTCFTRTKTPAQLILNPKNPFASLLNMAYQKPLNPLNLQYMKYCVENRLNDKQNW